MSRKKKGNGKRDRNKRASAQAASKPDDAEDSAAASATSTDESTRKKGKRESFYIHHLAAHFKVKDDLTSCSRGSDCRFVHRLPSNEEEKERAAKAVGYVKGLSSEQKEALVAKIKE